MFIRSTLAFVNLKFSVDGTGIINRYEMDMKILISLMRMDILNKLISLMFLLLKKSSFLIEPPREVSVYFQKLFSLETGDTTLLQVSRILINFN